MNIVILGLSLSSSWGNGHATTYRALIEALHARGHRVTFLERDVPWYASARDLDRSPHCDLRFYGSLDDLRGMRPALEAADAVILGSYVPDGVEVAEHALAVARGPVAFYDIDTPVTLRKLESGDYEYLTPALVPRFDLYLSFSGGAALEALVERWGARLARPLYCGVDTKLYHPTGQEKRWDLGYLGTYSADRQPTLERLLLEPARLLPERRFVVAGPQYPMNIDWPANVERIEHVPPGRHAAFYGSLRFALNVTRSAMIEAGHSPSVRLFEAAACGVPILTDPWTGIEDFFLPGPELLVVDDAATVVAILATMEDHRARAMGEAGRQRVLRDHTAMRRAEELERSLAMAERAGEAGRKAPAMATGG